MCYVILNYYVMSYCVFNFYTLCFNKSSRTTLHITTTHTPSHLSQPNTYPSIFTTTTSHPHTLLLSHHPHISKHLLRHLHFHHLHPHTYTTHTLSPSLSPFTLNTTTSHPHHPTNSPLNIHHRQYTTSSPYYITYITTLTTTSPRFILQGNLLNLNTHYLQLTTPTHTPTIPSLPPDNTITTTLPSYRNQGNLFNKPLTPSFHHSTSPKPHHHPPFHHPHLTPTSSTPPSPPLFI